MRAALLAAAAIVLPLSAYALEAPTPSKADPHIKTAPYDPMNQVLLVGTVGRTSTVVFDKDEHVTRVVMETEVPDGTHPWKSPDAKELQGNPLGNVLPLMPIHEGHSTGQVITKSPDGTQRVYQFYLVALPPSKGEDCAAQDCDDPRATYGLTFTYPVQEKQAKAEARQVAWKARRKQDLEDRVKTDIYYGPRNWKYVAQGTRSAKDALAPDEISDNTQVTAFLYLGNRRVPSVYEVSGGWTEAAIRACHFRAGDIVPVVDNSGGTERQITLIPQQDLLIAQETASHWRLRFGDKRSAVLDVFNCGFDRVGVNPWTGTTSPDVIRVVRKEPK